VKIEEEIVMIEEGNVMKGIIEKTEREETIKEIAQPKKVLMKGKQKRPKSQQRIPSLLKQRPSD